MNPSTPHFRAAPPPHPRAPAVRGRSPSHPRRQAAHRGLPLHAPADRTAAGGVPFWAAFPIPIPLFVAAPEWPRQPAPVAQRGRHSYVTSVRLLLPAESLPRFWSTTILSDPGGGTEARGTTTTGTGWGERAEQASPPPGGARGESLQRRAVAPPPFGGRGGRFVPASSSWACRGWRLGRGLPRAAQLPPALGPAELAITCRQGWARHPSEGRPSRPDATPQVGAQSR